LKCHIVLTYLKQEKLCMDEWQEDHVPRRVVNLAWDVLDYAIWH